MRWMKVWLAFKQAHLFAQQGDKEVAVLYQVSVYVS